MLKYSFISSSFELLPSCVPLYCFLLSRWLALQTCECVIDKPSAFPPYSNMFHVLQGEALPDTLNMDYPYNVSFKSLAYFLVAPTLCYQVAVLSSDLVNFWKQFLFICNCCGVASFRLAYFTFAFIFLVLDCLQAQPCAVAYPYIFGVDYV